MIWGLYIARAQVSRLTALLKHSNLCVECDPDLKFMVCQEEGTFEASIYPEDTYALPCNMLPSTSIKTSLNKTLAPKSHHGTNWRLYWPPLRYVQGYGRLQSAAVKSSVLGMTPRNVGGSMKSFNAVYFSTVVNRSFVVITLSPVSYFSVLIVAGIPSPSSYYPYNTSRKKNVSLYTIFSASWLRQPLIVLEDQFLFYRKRCHIVKVRLYMLYSLDLPQAHERHSLCAVPDHWVVLRLKMYSKIRVRLKRIKH